MNVRNRQKIAAILVVLSMLLALLAPMTAMAATPPTITPKTLNSAVAGEYYTQAKAFAATGLTGATFSYVYKPGTSALPDGMGFNTTGVVYGAPTETGTFSFQIYASGTTSGSVAGDVYQTFALTVKAPTIKISGTLAAVSEDVYFNTTSADIPGAPQFSAQESTWTSTSKTLDNVSPVAFTFSALGLPPGMNCSTTGSVYGKVYEAGSFPFFVTATDGNGFSASKSFTLTVKAPNATITATLPAASAGVTYTGAKISAKETGGGTISTVTITGLPDGLQSGGTVSNSVYTATLSGIPTVAGVYPLWITATDSNGFALTKGATLTVKAPNITITSTLPTATAEVNYTAAKAPGFTAKDSGNKTALFEFEISGLPAGLSANENTGAVTGTPTVAGNFPIQVVATEVYSGDNVLAHAYGVFTLAVKVPTITLALASGSSLTLSPGSASVSFTATEKTNGSATFTYTAAGKLPTGLSLTGGTISGTLAATSAGSYPIVICATDNHEFTCTKSFTLSAKSS
jgi:hypothetical protein